MANRCAWCNRFSKVLHPPDGYCTKCQVKRDEHEKREGDLKARIVELEAALVDMKSHVDTLTAQPTFPPQLPQSVLARNIKMLS